MSVGYYRFDITLQTYICKCLYFFFEGSWHAVRAANHLDQVRTHATEDNLLSSSRYRLLVDTFNSHGLKEQEAYSTTGEHLSGIRKNVFTKLKAN